MINELDATLIRIRPTVQSKNATLADQMRPFFTGQSSIELDKLAGYHKLSLELEITPHLNHQHGILIFSSQHGNGSGDFLSITLIDGCVCIFQPIFYHADTAWGEIRTGLCNLFFWVKDM